MDFKKYCQPHIPTSSDLYEEKCWRKTKCHQTPQLPEYNFGRKKWQENANPLRVPINSTWGRLVIMAEHQSSFTLNCNLWCRRSCTKWGNLSSYESFIYSHVCSVFLNTNYMLGTAVGAEHTANNLSAFLGPIAQRSRQPLSRQMSWYRTQV